MGMATSLPICAQVALIQSNGKSIARPFIPDGKILLVRLVSQRSRIKSVRGEGLAAPNTRLGKRTGGLATVSAMPEGRKILAYPPGLTESGISSCQ